MKGLELLSYQVFINYVVKGKLSGRAVYESVDSLIALLLIILSSGQVI